MRVLDEGMGIADEAPERLFELFYRSPHAARQAAGAGIGLFVCRQLIESMGGRIWAKRRDTGGSEFGFTLPILDPDTDDELDLRRQPAAPISRLRRATKSASPSAAAASSGGGSNSARSRFQIRFARSVAVRAPSSCHVSKLRQSDSSGR